MAEWSKAVDCKSIRKLSLVRIQLFSLKFFFYDFKFLDYSFLKLFNWWVKFTVFLKIFRLSSFLVLSESKKIKPLILNEIILKFRAGYFFVSLKNSFNDFFFYLHPGTYLVFFKKKKNYKKSKSVKLLITKHLRKLLILLEMSFFNVIIKGSSYFLSIFFKTLQKPLLVVFTSLLGSLKFNDIFKKKKFFFNWLYLKNTVSYCFTKNSRKRRLKRKIVKQLYSKNRIKW